MYRLHSLNNNENYWNKVYISYVNSVVQGIEYSVSSFTISDGIFGTCFFFGTGFHGLMWCVALCIYFLTLNYGSVATNIIINLPIGNINAHLKKLSTTINLLQFNKETFDSVSPNPQRVEGIASSRASGPGSSRLANKKRTGTTKKKSNIF